MTDKEKKQQRRSLKLLHNSITSAWSFQKIKTWTDVVKYCPVSYEQSKKPLSYPDLVLFLEKQTAELEKKLSVVENSERSEGHATNQLTPTITQSNENNLKQERQETLPSVLSSICKEAPKVSESLSSNSRVKSTDDVSSIASKKADVVTEALSSSNNYGFVPVKWETGFHLWYQKKAVVEIETKIREGKSGILLLSGTGTGKTYICDSVCGRLYHTNYHDGKTFSHIPYLIITRSTIVEQQKRVMNKLYGIKPEVDLEIINIEQLRSKQGKLWLKEEVKIQDGEEVIVWTWKKMINPCVIFFDESQAAKNSTSTQHKIMCAYSELPAGTFCLVSVSATPFTRVSEAKCFAISTRRPLEHLGFPKGAILCSETWPAYARIISDPSGMGRTAPEEYNQAAIERLMEDLRDYVVRVRGVRPQFEADNGVDIIDFETPEKKKYYDETWDRFLKQKAKYEKEKEIGFGRHMILVLLQQQAMAAEYCHAEGYADEMYRDVQNGFAAGLACKFKNTIIEVTRILIEKYGVKRDNISLIWGGGQTQLTSKQKTKNKLRAMADKLAEHGLSADDLMADTALDEVEDRELLKLPPEWRLGSQSLEERQIEIDKFQSGRSLYAMYTFKAGGVGLSLHHTDEQTEFKCRRKESGYAYEEDIPKVPVRPRTNRVALTYNAIELVQGLGRLPRITSLSPTKQRVKCYRGTVEEDIGNIVNPKLRCLSSVVKMHESWQDVILTSSSGRAKSEEINKALSTTEGVQQDESTLIDEGENEEDDD